MHLLQKMHRNNTHRYRGPVNDHPSKYIVCNLQYIWWFQKIFQLFAIVSLIQSMKNETFVNTLGLPSSEQGSTPQDTIPISTYSVASFLVTKPPPESPCQNINTLIKFFGARKCQGPKWEYAIFLFQTNFWSNLDKFYLF